MKLILSLKILAVALVFTLPNISLSQERSINLGDFTEVKVYSGLALEIIKSENHKLVITGEKQENVSVKNVNGTLKIYLKLPEIYDDEHVKVKLHYTKDISVLDVNEGASIFSNETIKQNDLTVRSQEGGFIHLVVDLVFLKVKTISGGNIRLRGKVAEQQVEAAAGGVYDAYELVSKNCDIVSSTGARTEINVTDILDAQVRFGGIIEYKGSPKQAKTKKLIGGEIKMKAN